MIRLLKLLLILSPGIPLSIVIFNLSYFSAPYVLTAALWFLLFLIASIVETKGVFKVVLFNIAAIILVVGIFEFYMWRVTISKATYSEPAESPYRIEGKKYDNTEDDILGYALKKNSSRRVASFYNDEVVYDVIYTTDRNGLRISPLPRKPYAPAILFFGGSFTYGEGVNDDETTPYLTGILSDYRYAVYNFAVHGHGAQHMLAGIEHEIVDSALTHRPRFAIYQVLNDHVDRLQGLKSWLLSGPHYSIDESGEVISSSISSPLGERLKGIKVGNKNQDDTRQIEIQTFAAVVEKSKNLLAKKYPGIEFHIIFWNVEDDNYGNEDKLSNDIMGALEKREIIIHKLSDILKDDFWTTNDNPYRIPHDGHPTPLMHKIMAEYIVNKIIGIKL